MIATVVGWLLPLLGNSFLKPVLDYLSTRQNVDLEKFKAATGAERDVLIAQLQAEVAANANRRAMASMFFGWWLTRWLIGVMLACAVAHQCAVFLELDVLDHGGAPAQRLRLRLPEIAAAL